LSALCLIALGTQAATITVMNTNDNGSGSLRQALTDAGNGDTIRATMALAIKHNVLIGAHPSFHDKENFGRKEMFLPKDKLYAVVLEQLIKIDLIAKEKGAKLHHVKPHGALYNQAAKSQELAAAIASAVKDIDGSLIFYGGAGTSLITEAEKISLKTGSEVFADRTYQADGSLTPRRLANALISDTNVAVEQARRMVESGEVVSLDGHVVPVKAETICIHGDGPNALEFAYALRQAFGAAGISVEAL